MTDYRTMSGADFQRAVGTDPEKWAEAFMRNSVAFTNKTKDERRQFVVRWFADAIEAGRDASIREVIEGDGA